MQCARGSEKWNYWSKYMCVHNFDSESRSVVSNSCDPMDSATPWTLHGILQARILEWVAFPFSRGSSQPRDWIQISHIAGRFFTSWAIRGAQEYWSEHPIPFSRGSSWPRNRTRVSCIAGGFFTNWAVRECCPSFLYRSCTSLHIYQQCMMLPACCSLYNLPYSQVGPYKSP